MRAAHAIDAGVIGSALLVTEGDGVMQDRHFR